MTAITSRPEGQYYERMASSLGDKARMIDFLLPGTVIDVGCGGGEFMTACAEAGFEVLGTDAFAPEVARSAGHQVFPHYASETHITLPYDHAGVDNVTASSVLHEVFSYGNRFGKQGSIDSLAEAFKSFRRTLRAGGRLVIRDGVSPGVLHGEDLDPTKRVRFVDAAAGDAAVEEFIRWSPYAKQDAGTDRTIRLEQLQSGLWCGRGAADLMELAFTLTWTADKIGSLAFIREAQEFYGIFTLDGYAEFVEPYGFRLITAESYTQPGYVQHMADLLDFEGIEFPDTNAVWVYEAV